MKIVSKTHVGQNKTKNVKILSMTKLPKISQKSKFALYIALPWNYLQKLATTS